jgi:hypothetical protein
LLSRKHLGFPSWPASPVTGGCGAETNHERTLSVPYVFRNHLI